jgi:hypothetical protein
MIPIEKANEIIYKEGECDDFCHTLWTRYKIESAPKFKEASCSHIPKLWEEDVLWCLDRITDFVNDKYIITQVKEKFAKLRISYHKNPKSFSSNKLGDPFRNIEMAKGINKIISKCEQRLYEKDLYPFYEKK